MHSVHSTADPAQIAAARALVASALRVPVGEIAADARIYELPAWDSLGQLSIVLAVEKALCARIGDPVSFNRLTSVPGIAAFLADGRDSSRPDRP